MFLAQDLAAERNDVFQQRLGLVAFTVCHIKRGEIAHGSQRIGMLEPGAARQAFRRFLQKLLCLLRLPCLM